MASTYILSDNGASSGSAGLKSTAGNDGTLILQTTTSGGTATTAVTIDNAQNMGLGVTPSAWSSSWKVFQTNNGFSGNATSNNFVLGGNHYSDSIGTYRYITSAAANQYQLAADGSHFWRIAPSGTAGNPITFTQAMTLDASGKLGVGYTTNYGILNLKTSGATYGLEFDTDSGGGNLLVYNRGGSAYGVLNQRASYFTWSPSDSEKMRLDSNGNLGLGVAPSAWNSGQVVFQNKGGALSAGSSTELYLGQNIYYGGSPSADRYVNNGYATSFGQSAGAFTWRIAPSGTAGNAISFTQAMTLDTGGNFMVGKTTAGSITVNGMQLSPSYAMFAANNGSGNPTMYVGANGSSGYLIQFYYTGNSVGLISTNGTTTTYGTSSDYRLKNISGSLTGYKERLLALQPKQGSWKVDGSEFRGFLAHEFAESYPASVSGEKDAVDKDGNPEYQGMQAGSSEVIADLVALVQELNAKVEAQAVEIAQLKGQA